jgi:hypothetical protein
VKVHPDGDGARVKLSAMELSMLTSLLGELLDDLQPEALDPGDPVRERLFPPGYRDAAEDAATFRDLTEESLRADRIQRAEQCLADISANRTSWRGTEVVLDAEAAERWLRVLNDMRLALGTRLGVGDEDDYRLHRGDPQLRVRARYIWLTGLQDLLVQSLLPD